MSEYGPNVRRLNWFTAHSRVTARLNEQPDGQWAALAQGGGIVETHIEYAADVETAARQLISWLEGVGIFVDEPPPGYLE